MKIPRITNSGTQLPRTISRAELSSHFTKPPSIIREAIMQAATSPTSQHPIAAIQYRVY
jgi:hypothetical protein